MIDPLHPASVKNYEHIALLRKINELVEAVNRLDQHYHNHTDSYGAELRTMLPRYEEE